MSPEKMEIDEKYAGHSGLIIKNKWLNLIFKKEKEWELRSKPTKKRGTLLLIESGSGQVSGQADIMDCRRIERDELKQHFPKHKCEEKDVDGLGYKAIYVWALGNVQKWDAPMPYHHRKGCVTWVRL